MATVKGIQEFDKLYIRYVADEKRIARQFAGQSVKRTTASIVSTSRMFRS
jgi:hypothetical protein